MDNNLKQKVSQLPMSPGVYIYRDIEGVVIYVGKAKSLRHRVGSYFQSGIQPGTKTYALVSKISDLAYIKVETELEALILEAQLIKKYKPKYNIIQKDDKSYLYIVVRMMSVEINCLSDKLPDVITERETDLKKNDIVFGPYANGRVAKEILRKIRYIFPFKDCSINKYTRYNKLGRPCLYGQLGLCPAPCVNQNPEDLKKYSLNITNIKRLLSGKSTSVLSSIQKKMESSSKSQNYEDAVYYRDLLKKFRYVSNSVRSPDAYIENPYLIDDLAAQALKDIKDMIPSLPNLPYRIECYDISNVSGKDAVGSMVVAINGQVTKSEYKRFRIKLKSSPDDFAMLSEVLERRLSHSVDSTKLSKWPKPDLLLIDGGKGQVGIVTDIVSFLDLKITTAGLAKKFETVVYKDSNEFIEKRFPQNTEGMKLLIRLRDEAHRFAQSYHHLLRKKKLQESFEKLKNTQ
jgi:excinuclease ABC subunit C